MPDNIATPTFFVLRSPLLPFEELLGFSGDLTAPKAPAVGLDQAIQDDLALLRKRLLRIGARPEIRDAIVVASFDLEDELARSLETSSTLSSRAELALLRYFVRMLSRTTPFGMFAGVTIGAYGPETRFDLSGVNSYKRHSRLDFELLHRSIPPLIREELFRLKTLFYSNSSLYKAGFQWRYAESRTRNNDRTYHLVAVDSLPQLDSILSRARQGAYFQDLVNAIVAPDISEEEAAAFVHQLIDNEILVSDLLPTLTGHDPVQSHLRKLSSIPGGSNISDCLAKAQVLLSEADSMSVGSAAPRYQEARKVLADIPAEFSSSKMFQVDMEKPASAMTLGPDVLQEILAAAEMLRLMAPQRTDHLKAFRDAFLDRYGEREVPLAEAVDEDMGIGVDADSSSGDCAPLIEDLVFSDETEAKMVPWGPRETLLHRKLLECLMQRKRELVLRPSDLQDLKEQPRPPLPEAFSITGSIAAASAKHLSAGQFTVLVKALMGPSGARLVGRFCHLSDELRVKVSDYLAAEEALHPDAIFAEIVHLPGGRLGNIAARPVLRSYEIPYLAKAGTSPEKQVPLTDLAVSVRDGRIFLRSISLDREVIPRLSCAHLYFSQEILGPYRFLSLLQDQNVSGLLSWDWGTMLTSPFLPRVSIGRTVLSRARWLLPKKEIEACQSGGLSERYAKVQALRSRMDLPRYVTWIDEENELIFDLDNVLCVETLQQTIKGRDHAVLLEMFPPPDELLARGPEGHFISEFIVPLVQELSPVIAQDPLHADDVLDAGDSHVVSRGCAQIVQPEPEFFRACLPGSEWLYLSIYTGKSSADRVIFELLANIREKQLGSSIDRWFFIRYVDPHWHVRIRFHGGPSELTGSLLPAIHEFVAPLLQSGIIWRLKLETYDREVERYGGSDGINLAEHLFWFDSEAVLELLPTLGNVQDPDLRWLITLKSMDMLLDDFGLEGEFKYRFARAIYSGFCAEYHSTKPFKQKLSAKYRKFRVVIESAMMEEWQDPAFQSACATLRARSEKIRLELASFKRSGARLSCSWSDFISSIVHMHVNRILPSSQRRQEYVLYDMLQCFYRSAMVRHREPEHHADPLLHASN